MKSTMQFPTSFNQNFRQPDYDSLSYNMPMPSPMQGNMTEDDLYPMESGFASDTSNPMAPMKYAKGGRVKAKGKNNVLPSLAEMIRQQGKGEDTILAHINPLEARFLQEMGGSGKINKTTGLPQYGGFFKKPGKALRSVLGGAAGTVIGNMIMPGLGGVIGGTLGQGIQHRARGKSFGAGALKGGIMGFSAPSLADLGGSGASALGAKGAGSALTQYGSKNAVLPSLTAAASKIAPGTKRGGSNVSAVLNSSKKGISGVSAGEAAKDIGFTDKLMNNSKDFLSKPKNILSLASAASSMANRPTKEKSPEQKASEEKRYEKARTLTPSERAAREADLLAERKMERRLKNYRLPEERFEVDPLYRRTHSPEEYERTGKWLGYSSDPEFKDKLAMKKGGVVPNMFFAEKEMNYPNGKGKFLMGYTKGQADKIPADLSDGEYIIPADVVAHIGDGNNMAGGKEFDRLVKTIRKAKGGKVTLPPKSKSLTSYFAR